MSGPGSPPAAGTGTVTVRERGDGRLVVAALPAAANAVWADLGATLRALPGSARVVVFAPDLFAVVSGLSPPADPTEAALGAWQDPVRRLDRADLVSVAALAGSVDGAALDLALACDLRILSLDARLTVTDVVAGLVPPLGGLTRLRALAGPARALELALTGRTLAADEAVGLGLATLAVARGELLDAADDLAAALLGAPRAAAVEAKALLRRAEGEGDHLAAAAAAALRLAAGEPG